MCKIFLKNILDVVFRKVLSLFKMYVWYFLLLLFLFLCSYLSRVNYEKKKRKWNTDFEWFFFVCVHTLNVIFSSLVFLFSRENKPYFKRLSIYCWFFFFYPEHMLCFVVFTSKLNIAQQKNKWNISSMTISIY
jgi:hypothetical protein